MTTIPARIRSSLSGLDSNPRIQYALLGLITLLAAGLRFYKLGEWSFWIDEIYTIGHAQTHYGNLEAILRNVPPSRNWIPLSVILTAGTLNALGTSEWSARLVSALIGVVSIPILYLPIKRIFGSGVGLIAALLLTVSPWHIYWSQNTRFYTSLMLLYSLSLFALYFGLERDRPAYLPLSIVLLYFAASERLFALFLAPIVVCYLLVLKIGPFEKPPGLRARNLAIIALPAIAFVIFEIYSFIETGSSITLYGLDFLVGRANHSLLRLLAAIAYRIGLPLICLGTAGGLTLLIQRKRSGILLSLAAWLPPMALLLMVPFTWTEPRYAFVSLPFFIILAAVALRELFVRTDRVGKILALGVLLLLVAEPFSEDLLYYQYQHGNRPNWRAAFALVEQERIEDDLVTATIPEVGNYYLDEEVIQINDMDAAAVQRAGSRVWFVIDEAAGYVAPDLKQWVREHSELIHVFELSEAANSLSIYIYLYDPSRTSSSAVFPGHPCLCYGDASSSA